MHIKQKSHTSNYINIIVLSAVKEEVRVCLESKTHLLELYLPEIALSAPPPRKSDFLWKVVTQKQSNVAKWNPAGLRKERWIYDVPDRTLLHALSVGPGPVLCTLAKGNSVFLGLLILFWVKSWVRELRSSPWSPRMSTKQPLDTAQCRKTEPSITSHAQSPFQELHGAKKWYRGSMSDGRC